MSYHKTNTITIGVPFIGSFEKDFSSSLEILKTHNMIFPFWLLSLKRMYDTVNHKLYFVEGTVMIWRCMMKFNVNLLLMAGDPK